MEEELDEWAKLWDREYFAHGGVASTNPKSKSYQAEKAAARAAAGTEFATNIFCGILTVVFAIISFAIFIAMLKLVVWLVI